MTPDEPGRAGSVAWITRLPDSIEIGAVRYAVLLDAASIEAYSKENYAEGAAEAFSDHTGLRIVLDPAHHSSVQRVSLLHEVLHCCLRQSGCWPDAYARTVARAKGRHGGYDVEELTIAGMTAPLLQVLSRNPDLVAYLQFGPNWRTTS